MRFYEQRYPEVDELVMVQVRQIAEMGAYVKLLEYDNIEGMILLSELSRRRIRSVQKLIRVGRREVVVVLRVDKEKGYIDLSKRRVSPEDIAKCEDRFHKSNKVHLILRQVALKIPSADVAPAALSKVEGAEEDEKAAGGARIHDDSRIEELYKTIAWPLGKQYGHPYDAFMIALTDPGKVLASLETKPSDATWSLLCSAIEQQMKPSPVKLRADVELKCFTDAGITAIKRALRAAEAVGTTEVPIKARLVAPPHYVLGTNATDTHGAVERLERAIEMMQHSIEEDGGELIVKMKPKTVNESDEKDLAQMMERAGAENAEVSGDEDEEDE